MKSRIDVILILLLTSCSKNDVKEYERLNSLPTQMATYSTFDYKTQSTLLDTIIVGINDGNYIVKWTNDYNEGQKWKMLHYYDPHYINNEGGALVKHLTINYDVLGDSLRQFEIEEWELGKMKNFTVNGRHYRVLKQPRWIFNLNNQVQPTHNYFFCEDFGLLITLTGFEKRYLVELSEMRENIEIETLINAIEKDEDFFNMK